MRRSGGCCRRSTWRASSPGSVGGWVHAICLSGGSAYGLVAALVLVFVFGWLLPRFVDYELIWEAIKNLTIGQLILLGVLTVVRLFLDRI